MREAHEIICSATPGNFTNNTSLSASKRYWHIISGTGIVTLEMTCDDGKVLISRIPGQWGEENNIGSFRVSSTVASDDVQLSFSDTPEFDIPGLVSGSVQAKITGPLATDAYSVAVGDKVSKGTAFPAVGDVVINTAGYRYMRLQLGDNNVADCTLSGKISTAPQSAGIQAREINTQTIARVTGNQTIFSATLGNNQVWDVDVSGYDSVTLHNGNPGSLLVDYELSNHDISIPVVPNVLSKRYNGNPGNVETQVVAAVVGQVIVVVGYSLSTDTAMLLLLHHATVAAATNVIAGGYYPASGGEARNLSNGLPGLAANQPVYILPAAAGNVDVTVHYILR